MEADRAKALEKDAADLRKKVDASGERLSRLEHVETILFRVHDKVVKEPASVTADNVLKVIGGDVRSSLGPSVSCFSFYCRLLAYICFVCVLEAVDQRFAR